MEESGEMLTLRDRMAMAALPGVVLKAWDSSRSVASATAWMAGLSYALADAMLEERGRVEEESVVPALGDCERIKLMRPRPGDVIVLESGEPLEDEAYLMILGRVEGAIHGLGLPVGSVQTIILEHPLKIHSAQSGRERLCVEACRGISDTALGAAVNYPTPIERMDKMRAVFRDARDKEQRKIMEEGKE